MIIAYVDSPFQLLQYNELEKEGFILSKVYVRLNGNVTNDKQLLSLVRELEIKNVIFINGKERLELLSWYFFILLSSCICTEIIIGDPNSALFKLLSRLNRSRKFLLLDDGVATLNNDKTNKIYRRFTIFPGYVKYNVHNKFNYLSMLIKGTEALTSAHIIIGSKFVDAGVCSIESYIQAICRIRDNLDERKCFYIPHRGESKESLEILNRNCPIEILDLDLPIEMISIEKRVSPLSISHILSTAVFSMRALYEVPFYTYRMPSGNLIERKEPIEKLYKILEKEKFPFI